MTYFQDVTVEVADGQTILDVSIRNRIPHHHQRGAQARCTTCRVHILDGISHVSACMIASFPCDAEFGRSRGIAGIEQAAATSPDLWLRALVTNGFASRHGGEPTGRANALDDRLRDGAIHCAKRAIY